MASMSPVFRSKNSSGVSFGSAIDSVCKGMKMTKLEWNDDGFYIMLHDDRLKLHKPDGKLYDLIVSLGDMTGTDWVVLTKE